MIPTPNYYPIDGGAWMTLRELEALGSWDHSGGQTKLSAYAALALVARAGGKAYPTNGMHVFVSQVDINALLGEMANTGPTPNDWS